MKDKMLIAFAGFFGGIGPSLAELASLAKDDKLPHFPFFIGAFIVGIMGMAVVLFAKETVPWKAFTQGMGAPALFSSATTAVTAGVTAGITSGALLFSPVTTVYADPFTDTIVKDTSSKKISVPDSVIIIIEKNLIKKSLPGSTIIIERDDFQTSYVVPDTDTVKLDTYIYDPVIRRSLVQGLLPMQNNLTNKLQPKLMVKEEKGSK